MKPQPHVRRVVLVSGAVAALGAVFMLYLQPSLALTLATQLWNCF